MLQVTSLIFGVSKNYRVCKKHHHFGCRLIRVRNFFKTPQNCILANWIFQILFSEKGVWKLKGRIKVGYLIIRGSDNQRVRIIEGPKICISDVHCNTGTEVQRNTIEEQSLRTRPPRGVWVQHCRLRGGGTLDFGSTGMCGSIWGAWIDRMRILLSVKKNHNAVTFVKKNYRADNFLQQRIHEAHTYLVKINHGVVTVLKKQNYQWIHILEIFLAVKKFRQSNQVLKRSYFVYQNHNSVRVTMITLKWYCMKKLVILTRIISINHRKDKIQGKLHSEDYHFVAPGLSRKFCAFICQFTETKTNGQRTRELGTRE